MRYGVDELLPAQDAGNVAVIEDPFGPGQSQRRAGDHDRAGGGVLCHRMVLGFHPRVDPPRPQPGCVEAAQRLVERRGVLELGMIREQREHVVVFAQHILDEAVQRLLRTHFHKYARAGLIQRAQPLDELHGRRNLPRQNVEHGGSGVGPRGIELAVHVGDDRQFAGLEVQALQSVPQRLAGGRHDRGVEGVTHRQRHGVVSGLQECGYSLPRPPRLAPPITACLSLLLFAITT